MIEIPTAKIADRVIDLLIREIELELKARKKVVTGRTLKSLTGVSDESFRRAFIKVLSDPSLGYIISGRRKGAKYPGEVVDGKFELFPEVREWKEKVGFGGTDFVLARAISENGIKPTPIIQTVLARVQQRVYDIILDEWTEEVRTEVFSDIRQSFRGL